MTSFTLKLVRKILFGPGRFTELGRLIVDIGTTPLFVLGKSSFVAGNHFTVLQTTLTELGLPCHLAHITGEPSPEMIDQIVSQYREVGIDLVVGIGGGATLDGGKAVAAMLAEDGRTIDYLEGVGTRVPSGRTLPFIAIPTTAGTGSEATSNAVISLVGTSGFKKSLRHDNYLPDIALVDPVLSLSCPRTTTVYCAMDCFTQLVEGYLSNQGTTITDELAYDGIRAVHRSLRTVCHDGSQLGGRGDLAYGALLSGIVLTNAGLGTVHGFASVIGGLFNIPHGIVCGSLMAPVNKATLDLLRKQQPDHPALAKYTRLGRLFALQQEKSDAWYQDFFVTELEKLSAELHIPKLGAYGIGEDDIVKIANQTGNKNNPVALPKTTLIEILRSRTG